MDPEKQYLIALNSFIKFGSQRLGSLFLFFQSWEKAFKASSQDLTKSGLNQGIAQEFIDYRSKLDLAGIFKKLEQEQIKTVSLNDPLYPPLLKEIFDPPLLLYYKGEIKHDHKSALAVVGSRKYTGYAKEVMHSLVADITRNNLTIVSGLAIGIDALAHQTALECGSNTIAVLGSGVDDQNIYPRSNYALAQKIISQGGAIVSEFPPGTPALPQHFPIRNRIVSGMCKGVLVVEAKEKSGSLITAYTALEQNREVFAVPGNINAPNSQGPNGLIKRGAICATTAADILNVLGIESGGNTENTKQGFTENEAELLKHLSRVPTSIDKLIRLTNLDTKTINSTLSILELKNIIKDLGSKEYIKN